VVEAGDREKRVELRRRDLAADPIDQFSAWFAQAEAVNEMPEAMTLATVDADGDPDARMVLLKGVGQDGFRFFTNYDGTKARQLAANPVAALVFHWPELSRQVRVRGSVEILPAPDSDEYFASRDRASQIGAWASPQSRILENRESLEESTREQQESHDLGKPVPRPENWGGYRLMPVQVEFWQGRPGRLHDRFRYLLGPGGWNIGRLAP
jgi:pyridoxamine 5'-phosphate oxidase